MSNAAGSKWIRPEKRLAIYARDGFACCYCGSEDQLSLDHLQPRELGGSHDETNLICACVSCNSSRRDLPLRAWLAALRDQGIDTSGLAARIRRLISRPLDLALRRQLLAARRAA
jgi:hypothetical protein